LHGLAELRREMTARGQLQRVRVGEAPLAHEAQQRPHVREEGARTQPPGQVVLMPPEQAFKGNKAALPSKPCLACGRPMSWRKAWAKNWAEVRYCSAACRKHKKAAA